MKTYWSEHLGKYVTVPGSERTEMKPEDAAKKLFMMKLVDQFKDFVSDSIDEGMHQNFDDHLDFMEACLKTFIEMKAEESK